MTAAAWRASIVQQAAHRAAPSAPRLLQRAHRHWRRGETAAYLAVWQPQIACPCPHNARLSESSLHTILQTAAWNTLQSYSPACSASCGSSKSRDESSPCTRRTDVHMTGGSTLRAWYGMSVCHWGSHLLVFSLEVCAAYASSQGSLFAAVGCLASCIAAHGGTTEVYGTCSVAMG